jgi:hypothetical protein
MPATNRLSRVAQWQNAPLNLSDFAAVHLTSAEQCAFAVQD